jgi:hypothetical protein
VTTVFTKSRTLKTYKLYQTQNLASVAAAEMRLQAPKFSSASVFAAQISVVSYSNISHG